MKIYNTKSIFISFIFLTCALTLQAQNGDCVQCNGSTASGNNASAIGYNTTASGNNSFAGGYNSQAIGSNSFAFGYNSKASQSTNTAIGNTAVASGTSSVAIGNYVKATAQNSFAFGSGPTASYPLTNSTASSIAFGVNSNKPTMLITKALNNNYTGKVAIGQITDPQAKLHLKSDNNEDAGVFLEPGNKNTYRAYIRLFDNGHSITVDKTATMEFNSENGPMNFLGESYCFGKKSENKVRIYSDKSPSLLINAKRFKDSEIRDNESSSYAIDFNNDAILFRTAIYQDPRGSEITNWENALYITTDGKIGVGSTSSFIANNNDQDLTVQSPKAMHLQSSNITLTGKVGVNIANTTSDYALAVDGGVISTKVFIKEVHQWPDHVFSEKHHLLGLDELRHYLDLNKHLPGVPSEKEVLKNGYDINDMQYILLEKIEELTRYIILLQDEIDELKTGKTAMNDTIRFTYDENGNRISRSLTFKRIIDPNQDPTSLNAVAYDLFPNPTLGQFSIVLKERPEAKMHAKLLTLSGVVIAEKDLKDSETTFDLSEQSNGIYLLEIEGPEGLHAWKVIKQ